MKPATVQHKFGADASLEAGLNPRVGPNVRLGDDPSPLPPALRAQAEPHIARHPLDPDTLLATFQEGRYTNGGAVTCGYSVSHDGGLTWTRAITPRLTTADGGQFYRATDPVAAIDANGVMYLNNLAAVDPQFQLSALLISRSTNGGLSFEPPVEITRSPFGTLVDKNWLAVNTFAGTPTFGRLVSTFTSFDLNGYPPALTYSDDQGATWSTWKYIAPLPFYAQGTQPVFLPDGTLAVVYWNFAGPAIEVRTSTDGGGTFTFSNRVATVTSFVSPTLRDGSFLPSAAGNRTNNSLYVVYQALHAGIPRVMFTMSTNAGVNWTAPTPISDNPPGVQVLNPTINASPDGRQLSVIFYDGRENPTNNYLVDLYLAYSVDGGATWKPNLRLSSVTSDARLAPLTASGYMLGDYMGVAAAAGQDVPAVGVFVDTRTGSPDPFVVRAAIAENTRFPSWRAARFSLAQIHTPSSGDPGADPDADGNENLVEYGFGLNPHLPDRPGVRPVIDATNGVFTLQRDVVAEAADLIFGWEVSTDFVQWTWTPPFFQRYSRAPGSPLGTWTDFFDKPNAPWKFYRVTVGFREP